MSRPWNHPLIMSLDNDKLPTNCLSVFDYFVGLELKGLTTRSLIAVLYKYNLNDSQRILQHHL